MSLSLHCLCLYLPIAFKWTSYGYLLLSQIPQVVFLRFLLTGSKISACTSEKRNNRATGKRKQGYYFHRKMKYLFQTIIVIIKFSFKRYISTRNEEKY